MIAAQPAENLWIENCTGFIKAGSADEQHAIRLAKVTGFYGNNLQFDMNDRNEVIFLESQCLGINIGTLIVNCLNPSPTDDQKKVISSSADSAIFIDHFILNAAVGNAPTLVNAYSNGSCLINRLEYSGPELGFASGMGNVKSLLYCGIEYGEYRTSTITIPIVSGSSVVVAANATLRRIYGRPNQALPNGSLGAFMNSDSGASYNFVSLLGNGTVQWYDLSGAAPWGTGYGGSNVNEPTGGNSNKTIVMYGGNITANTTLTLQIDYWTNGPAGIIG